MDLGTSLAYWVEATDPPAVQMLPFGLTALDGNYTRRQLVERYATRARCEVGDVRFYYIFGLFKIAVVAQQIYARYKAGLTRDEKFAGLLDAVKILSSVAQAATSARELT